MATIRIEYLALLLPCSLHAQQPATTADTTKASAPPITVQAPIEGLILKIGGYAKLDVIYDTGPIGNRSQFATNSIPVEGIAEDQSGQTTLQARESRINLDLKGQLAGHHARAFIEGDFYGASNAFRLRLAFAEFGRLLGGQNWTTFMDITARPRTLDYEGPDGETFVRQAMLRYTHPLSEHWKLAIAIEEPTTQIGTSGLSGVTRSVVPDIPAFIRFEKSGSSAQLAVIVRQLSFDGVDSTKDMSASGWGISPSFKLKVFGKDHIKGQFTYGSGIARYIESLGGQNLDGYVENGGTIETLPAMAGFIAYEHAWTPKLASMACFAMSRIEEDEELLGSSTLLSTMDGRFNLIYSPHHQVDFGGEVMYGQRENQNGKTGNVTRFQLCMTIRFS